MFIKLRCKTKTGDCVSVFLCYKVGREYDPCCLARSLPLLIRIRYYADETTRTSQQSSMKAGKKHILQRNELEIKKRRHERNWKRFFIRLTCFFWGIASGVGCNSGTVAGAILVFIIVSVCVMLVCCAFGSRQCCVAVGDMDIHGSRCQW